MGDATPHTEVVFVIGRPVEEERTNPDRLKNMMNSISAGSRVLHYDGLIQGALNSYQGYLDASAAADKIGKLVERL
jgi:hypothetical protein